MKIRRFIKSFRYGQKGFTLIELLVVIAILGILAAIVVPNFATFFGRGHTQACEIELRMVKTAAMVYASEHDSCATSITQLEIYFENPGDLLGTYDIAGTFPACTVAHATGSACP